MQYFDLICSCFCGLFCIFHLIVQIVSSKKNNKKIESICEKCLSPKIQGEDHVCGLTIDQLDKLYDFVKSIKENIYNGNSN